MRYQITNYTSTLDDAIKQAADNLLDAIWFRGMDDEQLTACAREWIVEV